MLSNKNLGSKQFMGHDILVAFRESQKNIAEI